MIWIGIVWKWEALDSIYQFRPPREIELIPELVNMQQTTMLNFEYVSYNIHTYQEYPHEAGQKLP